MVLFTNSVNKIIINIDTTGGGNLDRKQRDMLEKLERNGKNISKKEFLKALKLFGFVVDSSRGKGGHIMYRHPEYNTPPRPVNVTDPLRRYHIRALIKEIREVTGR